MKKFSKQVKIVLDDSFKLAEGYNHSMVDIEHFLQICIENHPPIKSLISSTNSLFVDEIKNNLVHKEKISLHKSIKESKNLGFILQKSLKIAMESSNIELVTVNLIFLTILQEYPTPYLSYQEASDFLKNFQEPNY
jgi:ATP-dependent Clp protease ATP-binding subunit ClpA